MLSIPKPDLAADKENNVSSETPSSRTKSLHSKRNFASIQTPPLRAKPSPMTLKHPALRDITNSANPGRINDVFPVSEKRIRRPEDSKKVGESKLRIAEPESVPDPETIEELLALPDDKLPVIEHVPPPQTFSVDEFIGLPEIVDISNIETYSEEEIIVMVKNPKLNHERMITTELEKLIIDPIDFHWAVEKVVVPPPSPLDEEPCHFDHDPPLSVEQCFI